MSTVDEVVSGWLKHRIVVEELLDVVADEHVNFKPWEGAMTLGELAVHIATSMDMFAKLIVNGEFTPPNKEEFTTMQDVRDIMEKYTEMSKWDLKSLNKIKLNAEIKFNKDTAPGSFWLSNAIDHEIHHKGQLFTYIRMTGAEQLPFFMKHPTELEQQ